MIAITAKQEAPAATPLWWAWSPDHGWVVLDRRLPQNRLSMVAEAYQFLRCSDWTAYRQDDQVWNYQEATLFLDSLPVDEAWEREQELAELQAQFASLPHRAACA